MGGGGKKRGGSRGKGNKEQEKIGNLFLQNFYSSITSPKNCSVEPETSWILKFSSEKKKIKIYKFSTIAKFI